MEVFGLPPESVNKPLIGMVSRFAGQKGFDLIEEIAPELLAQDLSMAVLGAGELKYEKIIRELEAAHPEKLLPVNQVR